MAKSFFNPLLRALCGISLVFMLSGCGIQSIPRQNNEVEASWAEVVNQYERRAQLIPNLVETVKAYAKHERQTLEAVIQARAAATSIKVDASQLTEENLKKFQEAQGQLSVALGRLLLVSEQYPNLKANENFQALQAQLEGTENRITIARRRYIETVRDFNNLITVFPTNLTNSVFFQYDKKAQFTVENENEIRNAPPVKFE